MAQLPINERSDYKGLALQISQLDFTDTSMNSGEEAIRAGSYSSPVTLGGTGDIFASLHALSAGADSGGFDYCIFSSMKGADSDDNLIGIHNTVHVTATGSSYPKTAQAIQGHALLDAGAKFATRGGDVTAGLYAGWFKVGGPSGTTLDSGSYTAAIWLDNQHSGTVSGTEYTIFSSTGGSVPDAWAGFDTSSSGWSNLFKFEDDDAPVGDSGLADTGSGVSKTLAVDVDGTQYYLVLYSAS